MKKIKSIFIYILIAVLIFGGVLFQEIFSADQYKTDTNTGLFVFLGLVIALLALLIVPKTKLASKMRMTEALYVTSHIFGIVCGLAVIIVSLLFPPEIVRGVLWKILLLPYALIQIYVAIIIRSMKQANTFDEKQDYDMTRSAAITFAIIVYVMAVFMFPLLNADVLNITLLTPLFISTGVLFFSLISLILFKSH